MNTTNETGQWLLPFRQGRRTIWTRSTYWATEAEIRARWPLAQRVDGTMRLRTDPAELGQLAA